MSSNLIRFGITVISLLILVSSILVVRAHFSTSGTGNSAATTVEQASLEKISAPNSGQPNTVGTDHFFPPVSPVFEPLLLLLLGSVLLSIASAIKLLLTRKLRQR